MRLLILTLLISTTTIAQTAPSVVQKRADLTEYGVSLQPDTRVIVMMAALEAGGMDLSAGKAPTPFRLKVRKDLGLIDQGLRTRLRSFIESKSSARASIAEKAAPFISLALILTPPPDLAAPAVTEDLPPELAALLDFAPLLKGFYQELSAKADLKEYQKEYALEAQRLHVSLSDLVRTILSYLHTRPITNISERVLASARAPKDKKSTPGYTVRERNRRFIVVPDLLAVPSTINFRVIADDYYLLLPHGSDLTSAEVRRAFLQYIFDAFAIRFKRDISNRYQDIKLLLEERKKAGADISTDVFPAVTRSLVSAANARMDEASQMQELRAEAKQRLASARSQAEKETVAASIDAKRKRIREEAIFKLAESYERGGVLALYFGEKLDEIEEAGFDIANFFPGLIEGFEVEKEKSRLSDPVVASILRQPPVRSIPSVNQDQSAQLALRARLIKSLSDVEELLRARKHEEAEARLKVLEREFAKEPRIYFARGQVYRLAAQDAFNESLQHQRLNSALENYQLAIQHATAETDASLLSRAYEARGRILAFLEKPREAIREYEAAIKLGDVPGGGYREALAGRQKLVANQP
jgi:hypothetical protein